MKLIYLFNWWKGSDNGGGAKKFNCELVSSLKNNYNIKGNVLYSRGNDPNEFKIGDNSFSSIKKILTLLRSIKPNSILVEGGIYFAFSALIYKLFDSKKTKIVYTFLTYPQNGKKASAFFLGLILVYFDKIVFVSNNLKDIFKKLYGYNFRERTKIIRPAITVEESIESTVERNKIILVAGLFSNKTNALGCKLIIDSFNEVKDEFKDFQILFLGDGYYKKHVEKYSYRMGLNSRLIFKGFVDNMSHYLSKSSLLLYASFGTGTPLTIIEAMSLKCTVLASKCGGIPEMIKNNHECLLFNNNKQDLTDKIRHCLKDRKFSNSLAENAYLRYLNDYTSDKIGNDYYSLINA